MKPRDAGRSRAADLLAFALLAAAVGFNLVLLFPETRISTAPLNDLVLHRAAAERLGAALAGGEPLLDPWVSEWSLGYPFWRSYQPLPHLGAALWLWGSAAFADPATSFAWLHYLSLALLPLSVFAGARGLGLAPVAAGFAALLLFAPSAAGDFGRYGVGYGASTWRGSGLWTQVVALHFLVLALGSGRRALDEERRLWPTSLLVAATALSHIVFAYVAIVSTLALAVLGPAERRPARLARALLLILPAGLLVAWFYLPLALDLGDVNRSRWEDVFKWDSFGAPTILSRLASGDLLDHGRLPALSLLVAFGAALALFAAIARRETLAIRLLALAALWLTLWFGRATWGELLTFAGIPSAFHLHRLQGAFELCAILLAAFGAERALRWSTAFPLSALPVVVLTFAAAIGIVAVDRAGYLATNASWGKASLAALEREKGDVDAALQEVARILADRPGRVSAGKAATWGSSFRVGQVPFYALLSREHLDQASFLYHSMSLPSEVMVLRDEQDAAHDLAFGIRAVIAPSDRAMPPTLRRRGTFGRFAVYEAGREGYFGLVDVGGRHVGPRDRRHDLDRAWLSSPHLRSGIVFALEGGAPELPAIAPWQALPPMDPAQRTPRGTVVQEEKVGERYRARLVLERPTHAFVKIGYHPRLVATVDGRPAPTLRVTPGFVAVPVPAGTHEVEVRWQPGPSKATLLFAGLAAFAACGWLLGRPAGAVLENRIAARLASVDARLAAPRLLAAVAFALLVLLAFRPLFRGQLIDGHDALEYPPRLVEMEQALADGHIPPVWAADLGNGHGQPLFAFAPPLLYLVAEGWRVLGCGLTNALQLALALLHAGGALAVFRLARRLGLRNETAFVAAAAWAFGPYVALDLYVRAAFAEACAVAAAPIALLGLLHSVERRSPSAVACGAAALALIPLSHLGAATLLFPALGLLAAVFVCNDRRPAAAAASVALTFAAGLGLSAFFWVGAIAEKGFVKTDLLREGFLHWSEHAIAPAQLFWSPWQHGFSGPGTGDGMSFALGPLHLLFAIAGLVVALASRPAPRRRLACALAIVAAAGAWLATDSSALLWSRVEQLQYLAYPWRALMLPALALPFLAALAFEGASRLACAAAVVALMAVNLPHTEPKRYLTFDDEFYAPLSIAEKGLNTTTREEYEPRWVEARPPYAAKGLRSREGALDVSAVEVGVARQEFVVRTERPLRVEAATFFYPGWTVRVDGRAVEVEPLPVSGLIGFALPAGEHTVVLELESSPVRRAGHAASLVTALLLLAAVTLERFDRSRASPSPRAPMTC